MFHNFIFIFAEMFLLVYKYLTAIHLCHTPTSLKEISLKIYLIYIITSFKVVFFPEFD